ncbi:prolyl 4-hydroxylase subunit alpha-2 [Halyomorpha halys]|uniref:prolyl 4-hydroxylase subunit alpha-2 n=1 Tax=Halyomorpha halys TaxID=286706 RepID=UPI0006D4E3DA|nr:prolyl 4-hydroxylase subunit alpha-2 [Halyomorpha halys]XP_014293972.1 prolyl 4-hydroxylase subunit alpha-2 [Halyomorpha halys]
MRWCAVWSLLLAVSCASAEVFTALADLEELLDTEAVFIQALESFIQQTEARVAELKRKAEEYKQEHRIASTEVSEYLSNPINAYLLVKRLTTDWKTTERLMSDDISKEALRNMTEIRKFMKSPTDEDLTGAAIALIRLQDTYKIDTASLAKGELNGIQYATQLSAGDCFELGRQSYNHQDFYHTVLWMSEALNRHEREINNTETTRWEILEYLAYSTYMQGNVPGALAMTDELLEIFPDHPRAMGNRVYYLKAIEKGVANEQKEKEEPQYDQPLERDLYEMACRNAVSPPISITSKLKCRYVTNGIPFLKLAPLKEEEAYLNPRIILFREAMYDSEIEVIKKMALPRLKRATVQNHKTGELETAHYRISKSAWLKEDEHTVVDTVAKRVEDMTKLSVSSAEELQVVNYGIGGHYEPHFDFARKDEKNAFDSLGTGNRIATVLFYMSDVAQGGATVFPNLRLALWPEKGTAAFWYNLFPDGEGDYNTRHAACPVLAGSKWVSNKWLHERDQEFRRPCELTPSNAID